MDDKILKAIYKSIKYKESQKCCVNCSTYSQEAGVCNNKDVMFRVNPNGVCMHHSNNESKETLEVHLKTHDLPDMDDPNKIAIIPEDNPIDFEAEKETRFKKIIKNYEGESCKTCNHVHKFLHPDKSPKYLGCTNKNREGKKFDPDDICEFFVKASKKQLQNVSFSL